MCSCSATMPSIFSVPRADDSWLLNATDSMPRSACVTSSPAALRRRTSSAIAAPMSPYRAHDSASDATTMARACEYAATGDDGGSAAASDAAAAVAAAPAPPPAAAGASSAAAAAAGAAAAGAAGGCDTPSIASAARPSYTCATTLCAVGGRKPDAAHASATASMVTAVVCKVRRGGGTMRGAS